MTCNTLMNIFEAIPYDFCASFENLNSLSLYFHPLDPAWNTDMHMFARMLSSLCPLYTIIQNP